MLYTLAQLGFHIDILKYGMNVVMDVIGLSVEIGEKMATGRPDIPQIDLCEPMDMEG